MSIAGCMADLIAYELRRLLCRLIGHLAIHAPDHVRNACIRCGTPL